MTERIITDSSNSRLSLTTTIKKMKMMPYFLFSPPFASTILFFFLSFFCTRTVQMSAIPSSVEAILHSFAYDARRSASFKVTNIGIRSFWYYLNTRPYCSTNPTQIKQLSMLQAGVAGIYSILRICFFPKALSSNQTEETLKALLKAFLLFFSRLLVMTEHINVYDNSDTIALYNLLKPSNKRSPYLFLVGVAEILTFINDFNNPFPFCNGPIPLINFVMEPPFSTCMKDVNSLRTFIGLLFYDLVKIVCLKYYIKEIKKDSLFQELCSLPLDKKT